MSSLGDLKVYATYPHDCSYLEDQEATTVFIDPKAEIDGPLFSQLSEQGFRRSGPHIYKPHCRLCNACIPSRIPVADFTPNRTQRRLLRRNADLAMVELADIDDERCYRLYHDYICHRHRDGDMYPPSREQYLSFLTRQWGVTRYFGFCLQDELIAVAVMDRLERGMSAVYTFFDHQQPRRSLGAWVILQQIALAHQLGLQHLYLGYWIEQSPKMAYKSNYRPLEIYRDGRWQAAETANKL